MASRQELDTLVGELLREKYELHNNPRYGACDCEWCLVYHEALATAAALHALSEGADK